MSSENELVRKLTDRSEDGHYRDGCYLIGHVLSPHLDGSGPLIISILDGQAMLTEEMVDRISSGRNLREGMTVAVIPGKRALRGGQRYLVQEIPGHGDILGRDAEDSHPIPAITGLRGELDDHNRRLVHIETVRLPDLEHDMNDSDGKVPLLTVRVGNLETGKADKVHTHSMSDISGLSGLAEQVEGIIARGGEPNVIETVKRNGTALPVSGKAVDVTVPTRVSELTNDSGYQNAQQVQAAVSAGLAFLLISETYGPAAIVPFSSETEGLPLKKCQVDIAPVQAGSGDPSPSNVRAISGWTGAEVHVTGKNLFDSDVLLQASGWAKSNGEYSGDNQQFYLAFRTSSNPQGIFGKNMGLGQVSISFWAKGTASGNNLYVMVYYTDGSYDRITINSTAYKKYTFTSDPAKTIGVIGGSYSQHGTSYFKDFQIELGGTVTEYEAFGKRAAVSFPAEAGTVYGGTLDMSVGNLTVTHGQIARYAGESLPGAWISDRDVYAAGKTPTTGAQVVYALASPVTYQLTPQTVTTLAGQNNVWADCGNVTVEYGAFLQALQQEIETIMGGG